MGPPHPAIPAFEVNPILAIGSRRWATPCGVPGAGFIYHEVAWKGACTEDEEVFDACLAVDADIDPTASPHSPVVPANMLFGRAGDGRYGDRLAAPQGRPNCRPRPTTRQRRRVV